MTVYADLYRYRELFANLFRRDLQTRYKGSYLGVFWSLLNPLLLMGIYVLVFSVLWKAAKIPHYALYVLVGLVGHHFARGDLRRHAVEPGEQAGQVVVAQQPGGVQHPRVRLGPGQVVGREPPVEVRRPRQRGQRRARPVGEATAPEGSGVGRHQSVPASMAALSSASSRNESAPLRRAIRS